MSHGVALTIDVDKVLDAEPIKATKQSAMAYWLFLAVGVATFLYGLINVEQDHLWAAYYVNLLFWMGLAVGGVITTCIFQIVRAKWAPPVQRVAEANIGFLLYAYIGLLFTYFGKSYLFPWGDAPMPGREWWMSANFVYVRFAIGFALLFGLLYLYVRKSLRADVAVLRDRAKNKKLWTGHGYNRLAANWKGDQEIQELQLQRSIWAPVMIVVYVVIYSLFAFEMIMGMDTVWFSNMFGGFNFVGNVYMGWATTILLALYYSRLDEGYRETVTTQQFWDLGKLTFGFCMLWGYMFLSQYLPQWYGNLPEETAWLLLRVTGEWQGLSYVVLAMCFVLPFILLLSEDLKKNPKTLSVVCCIILIGMWLEKYVVVMPQISPHHIPLKEGGLLEFGMFVGFFGAYMLSVNHFMSRYPYVPFTHPLSKGSVKW